MAENKMIKKKKKYTSNYIYISCKTLLDILSFVKCHERKEDKNEKKKKRRKIIGMVINV